MLGHPSSQKSSVSVSVSLQEKAVTEVASNWTDLPTKMSVSSFLNANDYEILESLGTSDAAEFVVQDLNEFVEISGDSEVLGTADARV